MRPLSSTMRNSSPVATMLSLLAGSIFQWNVTTSRSARILRRPEAVAAVPDVLLVRADDALLERVIAADLARADIVLAVLRPQLGDRAPATHRIALVPDRDILLGKALRFVHVNLL